MEYLEKMLGVSVKYHRWKGELELPYYITERYEMRLVELDEMKCIFLWPKDKLSQIVSLKKQLRRIQMEEALPVVFIMDMIDAYRRTAFLKKNIEWKYKVRKRYSRPHNYCSSTGTMLKKTVSI